MDLWVFRSNLVYKMSFRLYREIMSQDGRRKNRKVRRVGRRGGGRDGGRDGGREGGQEIDGRSHIAKYFHRTHMTGKSSSFRLFKIFLSKL
jgi:hypothetical protein